MAHKSMQDKEELILGTIIDCNEKIMKFLNENKSFKKNRYIKLYESKLKDIYTYNLRNLCEDYSKQLPTAIECKNNNYYSYFQKVYNFLNGYELGVQKILNESLTVNEQKVQNPIQVNIETFKSTLRNIINKLEKQNDIENYSSDIIKIKTFSKQPLFICGYNICNNIALMQELYDKFKITNENLLSIVYNKREKEIWFLPINSTSVIVYNITTDELKQENGFIQKQLDGINYLDELKQMKDNFTLIELYLNQNTLGLKFTDNLYKDISWQTRMQQAKKSIVKW